jgi:hypothetical protein
VHAVGAEVDFLQARALHERECKHLRTPPGDEWTLVALAAQAGKWGARAWFAGP